MSQRLFKTGRYAVQTGWDVPLCYYYLIVERLDVSDEDDDNGYVFSNLRMPGRPGMGLDEVIRVLQGMGIKFPHRLRYDLAHDRLSGDMDSHDYDEVAPE